MYNKNDSGTPNENTKSIPIIPKIKVSNLTSSRSGREVANQFEIATADGVYFQSYSSIIAFIPRNSNEFKIMLDANNWDYSVTTSKYRTQFLGYNTKEVKEKIKSGEYILADLN